MEPHKDNSILILHGWPSKDLRGTKPLMLLLVLPMLCGPAWVLQSTAANLVHVRIPYVVVLGGVLLAAWPLFWAVRWPVLPKTLLPNWQLQISTEGFSARGGARGDEWQPWSTDTITLFEQVRPDAYRVRIGAQDSYRFFRPEAVDLVVVCEDQAAQQVRAFIQACREGRGVAVPIVESGAIAARSVARRSRGGVSAGDGAERQIEQCPQCGYDLVGQPEAGRCPECGLEYDPENLIVLYGYNACSPGYLRASRGAWFVLGSIPYMFMFFGAGVVGRWLGITSALGQGLLVGGVLATTSFLLARRRHDRHNPRSGWPIREARYGEAQLRLSQVGFGMRLGYGACLVRPWSAQMHVRVERVEGMTYRLLISNSPSTLTFRTYIWGRLDFDSDERTVKRIVEWVGQWRQSARMPTCGKVAGD